MSPKAQTVGGMSALNLKGDKRQKNQLELAFARNERGEALIDSKEGTESLVAKHESADLVDIFSATPLNRRVRTRMHGGVGGGGP